MRWFLAKASGVHQVFGLLGLVAFGLYEWSGSQLEASFAVDPAELGGGPFGSIFELGFYLSVAYMFTLVLTKTNPRFMAVIALLLLAATVVALLTGQAGAFLPQAAPGSSADVIQFTSGLALVLLTLLAMLWV